TRHVLKVIPFGLGPCPRRRVGMCLIGSDVIICGGVGRNQSKEKHDHSLLTFGDTYSLHLLPSLQHLCIENIINYQLPVEILPVSIKQHIYTLSNEECSDTSVPKIITIKFFFSK
uniref:Uncharacterized protein n=1 Tax=Amphimedon queenslandica TaxID=400682 RepID=A0A1X7SN76_AMPQE